MKCFNCGNEVRDGLKFCTNCGVSFKDKIVYKKEVIYNDKVDGVNVANDKSAIIAILLVLVFCAFVIVMGISAIDKYNSSMVNYDPLEDPIEEEYYEFSHDSEFSFLENSYKFDSNLGPYITNGFVVEEHGVGDRDKDVSLVKDGFILDAIAHSYYSNKVDIRYYTVTEIRYEYTDKDISSKTIFELPNDIKIFDTYEDVIEAYGECNIRSGNLCEYDFADDDGEIRLFFDEEDELVGFRILNEAK